jgi:hypothetical protein
MNRYRFGKRFFIKGETIFKAVTLSITKPWQTDNWFVSPNLKMKLAELGLGIPEEKYPEVLGRIYEKSLQKKGPVTDDEFLEILEDMGLYKYKQEDLMRG